jgi:Fe-S-cluster containining protein
MRGREQRASSHPMLAGEEYRPRMKPSLTDRLCTQCGLCCDGSLFADVELAGRAEATRVEVMGLRIDDDADARLMLLPCAALRGTRCSVYAHRPQCCRTFECRLLQDTRRGAVSVERAEEQIAEAFRRIRRVKELLAQLGQSDASLPLKERCAEALAGRADASPQAKRNRAALEQAMAEVERLLQKRFIPQGA